MTEHKRTYDTHTADAVEARDRLHNRFGYDQLEATADINTLWHTIERLTAELAEARFDAKGATSRD